MTGDGETLIAMVAAIAGVVSAVVYYLFKWKEVKALREIRDNLKNKRP
jgi:uncharacterized membrane protein